MRSRFVPALLSVALLALVGRVVGAQGRGQDARPGIAVLPFDNSGSYGQDKENFDALQKGIAGMLISELAANPCARVVERDAIEKLLGEQNLGASGKVTPETAAKVGKLVGARYVITGAFIDFYGDFRLDARLLTPDEGCQPAPPAAAVLGAADESAGPDGGADLLLEGAPVPGSRAEGQGCGDVPAGAGRLPGVYGSAAGAPAREELVT